MLEKIKNKIFKTSDKILIIILATLSLLYVLSFTKTCSSTDKRQVVKSALINKKYEDKISMFELQNQGKMLTLSKKNDNWFIISQNDSSVSIPADNSKIANFVNDLITIQEMYKLSDKIEKNSSFGLNDSSSFYIRYYYDDKFNDIIFGNQDFALSSRYMMSGKSTAVYEISNMFDKYLSTNEQSWSEPYIISKQIIDLIKPEDVQRCFVTYENQSKKIDFPSKLLDLRHGGLPEDRYFSIDMLKNPLLSIKLELGNKNNITIDICNSAKAAEQEYFVSVGYVENSNLIYKSYCKISGWTYNKIKEVTL